MDALMLSPILIMVFYFVVFSVITYLVMKGFYWAKKWNAHLKEVPEKLRKRQQF